MTSLTDIARRQLTRTTHRIYTLPIVILMPHSRCNCRCVMCDIWKANRSGNELTRADLARHTAIFERLGVRQVVLSGGEALMHSNLWSLCALLKELDVTITLLSTGLLLARHAHEIVRWCDEVIVSLDGSQPVHDAIRNVPRAYERLAEGVAALRAADERLPVSARCVIQRRNYADLPNIIDAARELDLDRISFLAADVSSEAFNRPEPWEGQRVADVALNREQVEEFTGILETTLITHRELFDTGFVAESPDKLRRVVQYYRALNGDGALPVNQCNAPWVSTVIEADGTVRPCFFHRSLGNIHDRPLDAILNDPEAIAFRRQLDVRSDPICARCVCTLALPLRADLQPPQRALSTA